MNIKSLILASVIMTSLQANALIVGGGECARPSGFDASAMCWMLTMSSLPTMLIDGQAVDLNTEEADARLIVEAYGHADRVLIARLSTELKIAQEKIVAVVISQGEAATVKSVIQAL